MKAGEIEMDEKMTELQICLDEEQWKRAECYFAAYTHVAVSQIPEKFVPYVLPMKKVIAESGKIVLKYCREDVAGHEDDGILLSAGDKLTSKIISKAYAEAREIVLFAASVINIDQLLREHQDMMDQFFLEFWAVSVLSVTREWLTGQIDKLLMGSKMKQTSVWSPGQSRFELYNQGPLFRSLKPETMGLTLDRHFRMLPLKSISGTIGIVPAESEIEMISCDYCEHARTCPGYKGKKYADLEENRRLL